MLDQSQYAKWLHECLQLSSKKIHQIIEALSVSPNIGLFTHNLAQWVNKGTDIRDTTESEFNRYVEELGKREASGSCLLSYWDSGYPALLAEIYDPPAILHAVGNTTLLTRNSSVAVVGTRNPSEYGKRVAYTLSKELSGEGLCIVSGFAMGIDAYAHRGAVESGYTIAVLGCGIDVDYPQVNRPLREKILEKGLILSEFPLGAKPRPYHFPQRNRIISGLSRGTVVVEATPNSGSLITAQFAVEQNRDVFAIPGDIFRAKSHGCHQLIKSGASMITSAHDILVYYGYDATQNQGVIQLTIRQKDILQAIANEDHPTFDAIYELTGIEMGALMLELYQLEQMGILNQKADQCYALIKTGHIHL